MSRNVNAAILATYYQATHHTHTKIQIYSHVAMASNKICCYLVCVFLAGLFSDEVVVIFLLSLQKLFRANAIVIVVLFFFFICIFLMNQIKRGRHGSYTFHVRHAMAPGIGKSKCKSGKSARTSANANNDKSQRRRARGEVKAKEAAAVEGAG